MNTELMNINDKNFAGQLTNTRAELFCSLGNETQEQKRILFKAMNEPDFNISDCINQTIKIKNIFCETVEIEDNETGELVQLPHTVIFDDEGHSYSAISNGIFNSIRKLIAVFGEPEYDEPIDVIVKQKKVKKGNMLILDIA